MACELGGCAILAGLFFVLTPWRWPDMIRGVVAVVLTLSGFLVYLAAITGSTPVEMGAESERAEKAEKADFRRSRFQMPRRFNLRAIIIVTMAIAAMAAVTQSAIPSTAERVVTGSMAILFVSLISLMQLTLERVPRMASVICGAIWMTVVWLIEQPDIFQVTNWWGLLGFLLAGAVMGYVTGAMIGAIFLASHAIEFWWNDLELPTETTE